MYGHLHVALTSSTVVEETPLTNLTSHVWFP
jgi:hypothetical protein